MARGTTSHLQIITGSNVGCTFVIDGTGATADNGQVAFRQRRKMITALVPVLAAAGHRGG